MNKVSNDFLDSLDVDDPEIILFIPVNQLKKVIDLGCGKGAALIQLRACLLTIWKIKLKNANN